MNQKHSPGFFMHCPICLVTSHGYKCSSCGITAAEIAQRQASQPMKEELPALADLREQVKVLDQKIDAHETNLNMMKPIVDSWDGEIATIQREVAELRKRQSLSIGSWTATEQTIRRLEGRTRDVGRLKHDVERLEKMMDLMVGKSENFRCLSKREAKNIQSIPNLRFSIAALLVICIVQSLAIASVYF